METRPIGILGAMAVEVRQLTAAMTEKKEEKAAGMTFVEGHLHGVPCVVVQCGVGKVNAAACAQLLICRYAPRLVVNTGCAGGIGPEVKIGDLVVGTACVQHDFDSTALGDELGCIDLVGENRIEFPCDAAAGETLAGVAREIYGHVHRGVIASGDIFVADPERNRKIGEHFSAKACEMEGAAIAHVCYINQVPCLVIRAISDNANDESKVSFGEFVTMASEKSGELLFAAVESL